MQRLFQIIGAVSIAALTWAATAAALEDKDIISDQTVCHRGLNTARSAWVKNSFYAEEATRRGLTIEACRQLIAQQQPAPTVSPPPASNIEREFAVLSYETGLSPSFLAKFKEAAERLNIGPADARRTIFTLSGHLRDMPRTGTAYQYLTQIDAPSI